jgi:ABC-type multidrug transport system permease subunit
MPTAPRFPAWCSSIIAVAWKEFLHLWRDRRILTLLIVSPPFFTLLLGHAFQAPELVNAPAMLHDADNSPESRQFAEILHRQKAFRWVNWQGDRTSNIDLMRRNVAAAVLIPAGWGAGLRDGNPKPIGLVADGSDTSTAPAVEGAIRASLGEFQMQARDKIIENLPEEVIDLGKKLPDSIRKEFVSWMEPWQVKVRILYNPNLKFIDFVIPGIVGLVLQLLTVTLMASTVARERESQTLAQLLVTPLSRTGIVVGKVVPYFFISAVLIAATLGLGCFHFGIPLHRPNLICLLALLFLLCSLGLGLLISAISRTQTQAIQFSVFVLLPTLLLSGAFAPLERLPEAIQAMAELFPLTHFCRAFRSITLGGAGIDFVAADLLFLAIGAFVSCGGAAWLLRGIQD